MPICPADCLEDSFDVCIVGSGPAGLAAAFGCHDRGLRVLVVEAGGRPPVAAHATLGHPEINTPDFHDPVGMTSCSALGGTSHWWGGRSVPLDPVDFEDRPEAGSPGWPISHEDLLPWWQEAAAFLGSALVENPAPGAFDRLGNHDARRSESWGPDLNMARHWQDRLMAKSGPAIVLDTRATGVERDGQHITTVRLVHPDGPRTVQARHVVLACGGLGVLRLMLNAERRDPGAMVGAAHLGRGYMGHLTGTLADLIPTDPANIAAFGCLGAGNGAISRRRISPRAAAQTREQIANIAFWLDNPALGDPAHGSGAASAKYLLLRQARFGKRLVSDGLRALALRGAEAPLGPHLANIARHPLETVTGLARAVIARLTDRYRRPETLMSSGNGGWRLHYHAEQQSNPDNRVSLADTQDATGLYGLKIDYRFHDPDIASVLEAHDALDRDLQAAGAGRLRYLHPPEARAGKVLAAARDGYHQIGGTRMSRDPESGVVDPECRVHGLENLWIASSSVFPSAGQANPTLTIVALARRLAARLAN